MAADCLIKRLVLYPGLGRAPVYSAINMSGPLLPPLHEASPRMGHSEGPVTTRAKYASVGRLFLFPDWLVANCNLLAQAMQKAFHLNDLRHRHLWYWPVYQQSLHPFSYLWHVVFMPFSGLGWLL